MKTIDTFVSWGKSRPSLSSNSFCFSLKAGSWWSGLVKFKDLTSGHVSSSGANSGFRPNVGWGLSSSVRKAQFLWGLPLLHPWPAPGPEAQEGPTQRLIGDSSSEVWQEEEGNIHRLPCFLYLRPMTGENQKVCQAGCHQRNKSLAW